MLPKRYSFIVADRSSGVVHRFTLAVRPTLALFAAILAVLIGWTVQSGWSTAAQIEQLQLRNATLAVQNTTPCPSRPRKTTIDRRTLPPPG